MRYVDIEKKTSSIFDEFVIKEVEPNEIFPAQVDDDNIVIYSHSNSCSSNNHETSSNNGHSLSSLKNSSNSSNNSSSNREIKINNEFSLYNNSPLPQLNKNNSNSSKELMKQQNQFNNIYLENKKISSSSSSIGHNSSKSSNLNLNINVVTESSQNGDDNDNEIKLKKQNSDDEFEEFLKSIDDTLQKAEIINDKNEKFLNEKKKKIKKRENDKKSNSNTNKEQNTKKSVTIKSVTTNEESTNSEIITERDNDFEFNYEYKNPDHKKIHIKNYSNSNTSTSQIDKSSNNKKKRIKDDLTLEEYAEIFKNFEKEVNGFNKILDPDKLNQISKIIASGIKLIKNMYKSNPKKKKIDDKFILNKILNLIIDIQNINCTNNITENSDIYSSTDSISNKNLEFSSMESLKFVYY